MIEADSRSWARSRNAPVVAKVQHAEQRIREARRLFETADFDLDEEEFLKDDLRKVRAAVDDFIATIILSHADLKGKNA